MDFCGFFAVSENRTKELAGRATRVFVMATLSLVLLVVCNIPVFAQSPGYTDFSSPANLTLQGDAFFPESSPVLRLTPAVAQRVGGAWFNIKQPVAGGFTSVFTFQITNSSIENPNFPADGLVFLIQNAPPSETPPFSGTAALAGAGGSLGYS